MAELNDWAKTRLPRVPNVPEPEYTIRRARELTVRLAAYIGAEADSVGGFDAVCDLADVLLAERQQHRETLERIAANPRMSEEIARAALARDPSPECEECGHGERSHPPRPNDGVQTFRCNLCQCSAFVPSRDPSQDRETLNLDAAAAHLRDDACPACEGVCGWGDGCKIAAWLDAHPEYAAAVRDPAPPPASESETSGNAPCPHARPSWRMCPHCLGLNK